MSKEKAKETVASLENSGAAAPLGPASAVIAALRVLGGDEILNCNDVQFQDVPTPEFGVGTCVRIRNLTAGGRALFIQRNMEARQASNAAAAAFLAAVQQAKIDDKPAPTKPMAADVDYEVESLLVAMTAIDGDGKFCFATSAGEPNLQSVYKLKEKSAAAISRLAGVAQELSGLMPTAIERAVKT